MTAIAACQLVSGIGDLGIADDAGDAHANDATMEASGQSDAPGDSTNDSTVEAASDSPSTVDGGDGSVGDALDASGLDGGMDGSGLDASGFDGSGFDAAGNCSVQSNQFFCQKCCTFDLIPDASQMLGNPGVHACLCSDAGTSCLSACGASYCDSIPPMNDPTCAMCIFSNIYVQSGLCATEAQQCANGSQVCNTIFTCGAGCP
jgi:hypothetical protein